MPAGYHNPNTQPPRANNSREFAREQSYMPKSVLDLADFMIQWGNLPELEPYQTMPEAQRNIAIDIAERLFAPGVDADSLVQLYLTAQANENNSTMDAVSVPDGTLVGSVETNEPMPTVYVVSQYRLDEQQSDHAFRIPA